MGERTSAVVSYRTEMPSRHLAANSLALTGGAGSYSSKIPNVPLIYERAPLQTEPRLIADLIVQSRSAEEWDNIRNLATHVPVFKPPVVTMPASYVDDTAPAMAHASALMLTHEQPAANCCPCLPCNLL
jgi:hypothetical protein